MIRIYLSPPHIGKEEEQSIQTILKSNWIAPAGPDLAVFEETVCDFTGVSHGVALNSGTAAIHLALVLLDIKEGDEVLCSTFSFAASANPILYQKATPVFIESEPETWNINPETLEIAIKERMKKGKKPKALILVHIYGNPSKMEDIQAVLGKYDIPLIEDAAEALGSRYKNKALGAFGKIGIISFNGNKIITTAGGGILLSNEKYLVDTALKLATQAREADLSYYEHKSIGYNYRLSNVLAGIGISQMKVLEDRINRRRAIFNYYKKSLAYISAISFYKEPSYSFCNRWLSCILIDEKLSQGVTKEVILKALEAENIEARSLWKPLHLQPVFKEYPYYGNRFSEGLFKSGLCLPSGSALTESDLERITGVIKKLFT